MSSEHLTVPSNLFTVRLWPEEPGSETDSGDSSKPTINDAGPAAWHGQVTHVLSGEVRWFRAWPELIDFLGQRVRTGAAAPGDDV